jgi:hypothetical protein
MPLREDQASLRSRLAATRPSPTSRARSRSFFISASLLGADVWLSLRAQAVQAGRDAERRVSSDSEEVAGARVRGRVTQLRHGASLNLTDALTGEVEVLAHLFERPWLTTVEPEA